MQRHGGDHHHGTVGHDRFDVFAERIARGFGTPPLIIGQTVVVAPWIAANAAAFGLVGATSGDGFKPRSQILGATADTVPLGR